MKEIYRYLLFGIAGTMFMNCMKYYIVSDDIIVNMASIVVCLVGLFVLIGLLENE